MPKSSDRILENKNEGIKEYRKFFCSNGYFHCFFVVQIIVGFLGIFIALAVEMMSSSAFTETISDNSSLVITIAANLICLYNINLVT